MINRHDYINSPIEIERELLQLFDRNAPLVIFDIGACEAEDSIRYANLFPNASVYAFEPRTDNCIRARELIARYTKSHIQLEQLALSEQNGEAEFYLSEGEPGDLKNSESWDFGNKSSSLLPPSDQMKVYTGWLQFNNRIKVQTIRLDTYVAGKGIDRIDFAHIDVQGAELMVLSGAGDFLSRMKVIWLEVEAVELYRNQPLKNDVEAFMEAGGFVNVLNTVDQVSGDQLYVNRRFFSAEQLEALREKKEKKGMLQRILSFFQTDRRG